MKIIITEAQNGYIIELDDFESMISKFVVVQEDSDDEYTEARLNHKLLTKLQEVLEYYPSKHDKVRCKVTLEEDDEQ